MITAEIKQDGETVCKITAHKTEVKISRSFAYRYKYEDLGIGEEILDHVLVHEKSSPEQVIQEVLESVYGN